MCLSFCNKFFFIYLIIYSKLEHEQLLNPSSDFDVFCLHFVAMQLVTDAVDGFARGWNAHPISTENNFSPNQLFVLGLLQLKNSGFMHEELNQSNVVNKMAKREAQIMAEKSYSNRRVQVPPSHLHCLKRN